MKTLILALIFSTGFLCINAQETITTISMPPETPGTNRVYAELLGFGTNFLGLNKNVTVSVDLGQYQSAFKPYTLLDENGKTIKFNSMVAAMNYMGERGWKFIQTYVVSETSDRSVYHWLMYKDITAPEQIYEGIRVSNTESAPKKPKKKKKKERDEEKQDIDDLYGE